MPPKRRFITCEICGNRASRIQDEKRMFMAKFPVDESRCRLWVKAVGNEDLIYVPIEKLHTLKYVCGNHFENKEFNKKRSRLKKSAVPSKNLRAVPLSDEMLRGFPCHINSSTDIITDDVSQGIAEVEAIAGPSNSESYYNMPEQQPTVQGISEKIHQSRKRKWFPTSDVEVSPRKRKLLKKINSFKRKIKVLREGNIMPHIKSLALKTLVKAYIRNRSRKPQGKRWTPLEKALAIAIYKKSPRVYRYLKHLLALPSIRTLQTVLQSIELEPGISRTIINHLKKKAEKTNEKDKTPIYTCKILEDAVARLLNSTTAMKKLLSDGSKANGSVQDPLYRGVIDRRTPFRIDLYNQCEDNPHFDMDESYYLTVGEDNVLTSYSVWGILRGLETLSQLLYLADNYTEIRINATRIEDYPAYKYRGLLIDTGRHYLQISTIKAVIKAMAMNKMNALHWHIVDDQSFPYQSEIYPTLSEKGAFHPNMVYTKEDIKQIVDAGRSVGIRVIPEFDVPGHTRSWGAAYPDILTKCYENTKQTGLGPLNPINNSTFTLIQKLLQEVREWFPDEYIHLGGDEVNLSCWSSNPLVKRYMKKHNLSTHGLHAEFMRKVIALLPPQTKTQLWQEVFDTGVPLNNKPLVHVWKYKWIHEMDAILKAGQRIVFSSSWYLDYLDQGWETFYAADPRQMVYQLRKNETGLKEIVGGEACMWGEMVDDNNIIGRVWPRASAVAERLWTGLDYKQSGSGLTNEVRQRLEEHACRMVRRGIAAEPPNGPGFCLVK